MLALGQPVRAEVLPERAVVDGHDLGRGRVTLRTERREAVSGHAVDLDPVDDAHRKRTDDGLRANLLSALEPDAATRPTTPRSR